MTDRSAITRRQLLGMAGGIGVGAGLVACGISTESGAQGLSTANDVDIAFPKTDGTIPGGEVTLTWMDNGIGLRPMFEKPMFAQYEKTRPNVAIQYDAATGPRIKEAIPLAARNNSLPDAFVMPGDVPTQVAINEGWIQPIDDLVPDFETWKKRFPPSAFLEGIHVFGGKTYTFPVNGSGRYGNMIMFDSEYLAKADVDPVAERFTWSSFRQACKKITAQGDGDYYALMTAGDQLAGVASAFARMAGWRGVDGMDPLTGEFNYTAPELEAAIEVLLAIASDKSIFPGYIAMELPVARKRMPQRIAAMIFNGAWDIPEYRSVDYDFKIALPPTGDDKKAHPVSYREAGENFTYVSADSELGHVVGEIFGYMGSLQGQINMIRLAEGNIASVMPRANQTAKREDLDPQAAASWDVSDQLMRVAPMVEARNPDVAAVVLARKPVTPSLEDLVEGIFSDQIDDIPKALKTLNDASERSLDQAIDTARGKGAEISRDDWVFPNWDPAQDYTPADYAKLPK